MLLLLRARWSLLLLLRARWPSLLLLRARWSNLLTRTRWPRLPWLLWSRWSGSHLLRCLRPRLPLLLRGGLTWLLLGGSRLLTCYSSSRLSNFGWDHSRCRLCHSLYGGGCGGSRRFSHLCGLGSRITSHIHSIVGKTFESAKSKRHDLLCRFSWLEQQQ